MRFLPRPPKPPTTHLPPPTSHPPTQTRAGDGLLYLPGLSLATPQYSRRIKWQAIYNASVKAGCIAGSHPHLPGLRPHQTPSSPSFLDPEISSRFFVFCCFFLAASQRLSVRRRNILYPGCLVLVRSPPARRLEEDEVV